MLLYLFIYTYCTLFLNPFIPIRMDRLILWPTQHASKQRQRPLLWSLSVLFVFITFTFETFISFQSVFFHPLLLWLIYLSYRLIALYAIFFAQKLALNSRQKTKLIKFVTHGFDTDFKRTSDHASTFVWDNVCSCPLSPKFFKPWNATMWLFFFDLIVTVQWVYCL